MKARRRAVGVFEPRRWVMRIAGLLVLFAATFGIVGCSEGPPTAGEPRPFGAVCDKANDGKRVSVEGYLALPDSFTGSQSAVLRLYQTADETGQPIGVQIPIGAQPNQMEMPPKQYSAADLKV